ncbi:hypothetical protein Syun_014552 [Stephania yunnanensis]|uniref:Uncharacterized protein n=1 Tax=Stephania yunnanensis TaxID=152371 RepID=A0AAP0JJS9_9MAGN
MTEAARDETERPRETARPRRRERERQHDRTEIRRPPRPDGRARDKRERPASTTRRRDETIERDGRLGTRRSTGATRRRDRFRFLRLFRVNDLGISAVLLGRGGGVRERK